MGRWFFVLLAALMAGAFLGGLGKAQAAEEVPRITVAELQTELGSPDLVIIDVRQDADWRKSDQKIAGAVREDPSATQTWAGNYAKEKKVVLYCT